MICIHRMSTLPGTCLCCSAAASAAGGVRRIRAVVTDAPHRQLTSPSAWLRGPVWHGRDEGLVTAAMDACGEGEEKAP